MAPFFGTETCRPAFDNKPTPRISYGLRFPEAVAAHVDSDFHSRSVFVIASRSLDAHTDAVSRLKAALGPRLAGVHVGISPHTPVPEVLDIVAEVRALGGVDCIVTLGAGSVTDGAKLVRFALANAAYDADALDTLWGKGGAVNPRRRPEAAIVRPTAVKLVHVPTSLSGGEYQSIAGATDARSAHKHTYEPGLDPELVVQDPELAATTPAWVWLSTGVRAVDHCVETIASNLGNARGDEWARRGLAKLVPGLLRCKRSFDRRRGGGGAADNDNGNDEDEDDEEEALRARHQCQLGVVEAMCAVSSGVPLGASHAIGHQLGPLGVGHGETSCILLPAVCRYNAARGANTAKQADVARVLRGDGLVAGVLAARGAGRPVDDMDLADMLDLVIRELGLPRSLKDVKVGRDKLPALAKSSLNDIWIKTNAVPITEEAQVMEILEMVAE
ncbi:hypothetical protein BDY21DRAFT_291986 [Lineolata rhizophorae]|uniref:Uncharacterized protein n=1 Tax=Lineolata rhizophorae TaxID=578093 RepID=A0A6A6NR04_9PEZI|nr:hypothetical protein BDY21DRAFT_291986 [Lineolata rhizophorae]